jgi:glycosyltransferase involved in cell wall biosynthesis
MPEVSVIIPTFNYGRFLATAIGSVLGQTVRDLELVVVDDGSTDNTRDVVSQFASDLRVRYLYQSNQGDAPARIAGLSIASGRYLAFLDSDDYWMPEKLELQLAAMLAHPQAGAVHSAIYLDTIDQQQRVLSRTLVTRPAIQERTLYEELLYRMIITGSHS